MNIVTNLFSNLLTKDSCHNFYRKIVPRIDIIRKYKSLMLRKPKDLIVVYLNTSYLPFFENWIYYYKKLNIENNLLIFSSDKEIYNYYDEVDNIIIYDKDAYGKSITNTFSEFKDINWNKITLTKLVLVKELLDYDKNIIFSDLDVVFLKNPIDYLNSLPGDILFQCDSNNLENSDNNIINTLCTGFYFVRPSDQIKLLFDIHGFSFLLKRFRDDQDLFQAIIHKYKIDASLLDRDLFPNGYYLYNKYYQIKDKSIIMHFNWLKGNDAKMNKMKEYDLWLK